VILVYLVLLSLVFVAVYEFMMYIQVATRKQNTCGNASVMECETVRSTMINLVLKHNIPSFKIYLTYTFVSVILSILTFFVVVWRTQVEQGFALGQAYEIHMYHIWVIGAIALLSIILYATFNAVFESAFITKLTESYHEMLKIPITALRGYQDQNFMSSPNGHDLFERIAKRYANFKMFEAGKPMTFDEAKLELGEMKPEAIVYYMCLDAKSNDLYDLLQPEEMLKTWKRFSDITPISKQREVIHNYLKSAKAHSSMYEGLIHKVYNKLHEDPKNPTNKALTEDFDRKLHWNGQNYTAAFESMSSKLGPLMEEQVKKEIDILFEKLDYKELKKYLKFDVYLPIQSVNRVGEFPDVYTVMNNTLAKPVFAVMWICFTITLLPVYALIITHMHGRGRILIIITVFVAFMLTLLAYTVFNGVGLV
jgi:hypothetical protein